MNSLGGFLGNLEVVFFVGKTRSVKLPISLGSKVVFFLGGEEKRVYLATGYM